MDSYIWPMRFIIPLFVLLPFFSSAQNFKRQKIDYEKLPDTYMNKCDKSQTAALSAALQAVDENNSDRAVSLSKPIYEKAKECHLAYEVYGYSLFRNGKRLEGIKIIEEGIQKLGSVPELIKRRADMSLELGELGPSQSHIDGNMAFKGGGSEYEEEQFKIENLKSTLQDLEYLQTNFGRDEEKFIIAMIHQKLGHFTQSNSLLELFRENEEYGSSAIFNMADNYLSLKQANKALEELKTLEKSYPREPKVLSKIREVYKFNKNNVKEKEYQDKAFYYRVVPHFLDMEFTSQNIDLIKFFLSDTSATLKINKLNRIHTGSDINYTIDVCLVILKLHANHGNNLEERASEILTTIGKPAVEKMHALFKSNISTCSITNLGYALAGIKDDNSWNLLVEYLNMMHKMPSTLILPNIPGALIKYDEDKGLTEILKVIKKTTTESDDDLGSFGHYIYYMALDKIDQKKLTAEAKRLGFSDKQLAETLEKVYEE